MQTIRKQKKTKANKSTVDMNSTAVDLKKTEEKF